MLAFVILLGEKLLLRVDGMPWKMAVIKSSRVYIQAVSYWRLQ